MIELTLEELETWIKENKPFKIKVDEALSKQIQRIFFNLGRKAFIGIKDICHLDKEYLYFLWC